MSNNTLDQLVPKIAARGLLDFRQKAFMPQIVNADYSAEAAQKGDQISVMVPGELTVNDVVPGKDQVAATESNPNVVNIPLDKWKSVSFYLTDKELMQIDADEHFLPFQMTQAISALATEVNKSFLEEASFAKWTLGHHKKPIFSTDDTYDDTVHKGVQVAIDARKCLNKEGAAKEARYGLLGFEQEADAMEIAQFADVSHTGDSAVRMEGELGRKFGIDWIGTDQIPKTRATPPAETFVVPALVNKGGMQIRITGVQTPPKIGDIIVKSSNDEIIGVVESIIEIASNDFRLNLYEPLSKAVGSNTLVKYAQPANVSLVFQRNAFAFATRPLAAATEHVALGSRIISLTDPLSGLSLRLEIYRQHKQTVWEFDVLWGVKMVRPELAVRAISS